MLEKTIEQKLVKEIKKIGGLCLKFESPGYTGVPDRIILLPGGGVVFVELKAPGKKERARQQYVQKKFKELGVTVFSTVRSYADINNVVFWCKVIMNNSYVFNANYLKDATDGI